MKAIVVHPSLLDWVLPAGAEVLTTPDKVMEAYPKLIPSTEMALSELSVNYDDDILLLIDNSIAPKLVFWLEDSTRFPLVH